MLEMLGIRCRRDRFLLARIAKSRWGPVGSVGINSASHRLPTLENSPPLPEHSLQDSWGQV